MALFQVTIHQFLHGSASVRHWMDFYTYAPPHEPQTHEFNKVASTLVFAERMLKGPNVEFGRVVFLRLDGEEHHEETVTVTCIPFTEDNAPVFGLRAGTMLDAFYGVSVVRNTKLGPKYKRTFMGALGMDDLPNEPFSPYMREHLRLNPKGTFAWLLGWWRYIIQTLNYVDPSREYDRFGRKVDYEDFVSPHLLNSCSDYVQLRNNTVDGPDVVQEWNWALYYRDKSIRGHLMRYWAFWESRSPNLPIHILRDLFEWQFRAADMPVWVDYEKFLKPSVPAGALYHMQKTFAEFRQQNPAHPDRLQVREPQMVSAVLNRSFQIHQFYSKICYTRSGKDWGMENWTVPGHPEWEAGRRDIFGIKWRELEVIRDNWVLVGQVYHDGTDTRKYINLPFADHHAYYVWIHSQYDKFSSAWFAQISLQNVLDQIILPTNKAPKRTPYSARAKQLPRVQVENTFPRQFEMVPYIAIQPKKCPEVMYPKVEFNPTPKIIIRTPSPVRVPKRADGLPTWWQGIPPEPDYEGALDALGDWFDEEVYDVDEAARNIMINNAGTDPDTALEAWPD